MKIIRDDIHKLKHLDKRVDRLDEVESGKNPDHTERLGDRKEKLQARIGELREKVENEFDARTGRVEDRQEKYEASGKEGNMGEKFEKRLAHIADRKENDLKFLGD